MDTNVEKIKKGLDSCRPIFGLRTCDVCPYKYLKNDYLDCQLELMNDAYYHIQDADYEVMRLQNLVRTFNKDVFEK